MKVAFCLFKYFPFGGLERDFLRIAQAVESKGVAVRVYVQEWQGEQPNSFEVIHVPTKAYTNHGQGKRFIDWVSHHLKENPVDAVVGFNKMPGLDFYYAADVCYAEKVDSEKKGILGRLYRFTSRYRHYMYCESSVFARGSKTHLLMISEAQVQSFKKFYDTEEERVVLLPPGIELNRKYNEKFTNFRKKFRADNNISDEDCVLLQLGSDFRRKGVDRTLRAMASLSKDAQKKVILVVVGEDKPDSFCKLAKDLAVESRLVFFNGRNDVPTYLAAADIFIHPAYSENTGTVILEALVAGLPIITTEKCGYANYVRKANCGFVISEPYSQNVLNQLLLQLINNVEERNLFSANAINFSMKADLYSMVDKASDEIISYLKQKNSIDNIKND